MYTIMTKDNDVIVVDSSEVSYNEKYGYKRASEHETYKRAFVEAVLLQETE
ncbi:hypothetical protein [Paenibacillus antarcticus]|uniref:hypothetical protein n=1 Tax=Paenibacillus antarcticus TaxID=253703 RepID=UPI000A3F65BA|nr:hypothetical protein [Paenibacillus antarcticus]